MAKLRHIALAVPDPEKAAQFYSKVFDMEIVEPTYSPIADGVYLSDGIVCLALLKYKTDEAAGKERGKNWIGTHHFGFWVDDVDSQREVIEANGGTFFLDLPHDKSSLYYEMKFRDPDGIIFDISEGGWVGAKK
ncbi:VOC family protein [Pusillimonas noertemannii]|uniref:Catechol 2,3-dioxygenase-like lactoylglutathione lyase family enzyme n=1 Tax=Pusillimonas noertemannii TaxID=305977 RepID=A0A2U1CH45_9BURK|nr:VOC family protein [Pusillimonas noertemannii]NYT70617.1 VOC family protein [Pusillimonas noertemannii]PVY60226.1 catechol 2,3-dioxygenase-like lactoylglutathione lyase family enzyme [Pusillimonas noertemannii]TFL07986.1 VOC family protein [Pusillimonas noertemannii]